MTLLLMVEKKIAVKNWTVCAKFRFDKNPDHSFDYFSAIKNQMVR